MIAALLPAVVNEVGPAAHVDREKRGQVVAFPMARPPDPGIAPAFGEPVQRFAGFQFVGGYADRGQQVSALVRLHPDGEMLPFFAQHPAGMQLHW